MVLYGIRKRHDKIKTDLNFKLNKNKYLKLIFLCSEALWKVDISQRKNNV